MSRPSRPSLIDELPATLRAALLAGCEIVSYPDGAAVVQAGEEDQAYYLVMSGAAEVFGLQDEPLRMLGPGDGFGELALLLNRPRSATVRARGSLVCSRLSAAQFWRLIDDREHFAIVASTLAARQVQSSERLEARLRSQQRAYLESLQVLSEALEARDPRHRGHAARCGRVARLLAAELRLPPEEQERAELLGLLHDVGAGVIPDAIAHKQGPLDADDWARVRAHPAAGAELLARVESLATLAPAVRAHHERWDGRGYPDGLAGAAIPLGARIVAVADAYDAITTARPDRPPRDWPQAAVEIAAARGTQFDPTVVDAFLALARRAALEPQD